MLKDNGKMGPLRLDPEANLDNSRQQGYGFKKIKSSQFDIWSFKKLQMHGKTMNFGFCDETSETVFLKTRDQAKNVEWHSALFIIFKI
jgi:hypothetical protein